MRRLRILLCLMAVLAALVPASGDVGGRADVHVPTREAQGLATLLPKETVFFVSVRDVPGLLRKLKELPLYKVLSKEGVLERLLPPEAQERVGAFYGTYVKPLGQILRGELAFALTDFPPEGFEAPGLLVLADVGRGEAALKRYLEEAIYPWVDQSGALARSTVKVEGTPFTRIGPAGFQDVGVVFGVKDGAFMLTAPPHHKELLGKRLERARDESLASNPWFTKVERALSGADFMEYVNLGAIDRRQLDRHAAQGWKDEYDRSWGAFHAISGFDPLEAIGMGMTFGPDGSGTTVCLLGDGPHRGIAGMLARKPGPLKSLAYVDEAAAVYLAVNVGTFSEIYEEFIGTLDRYDAAQGLEGDAAAALGEVLAPIEAMLDLDVEEELLPAFGGEVAIAGWIPGGLDVPPAALMIEVKDKETVGDFVERALELIEDAGGGEIKSDTDTYEDVEIISLDGVPHVIPAVAIVGDFLVVATNPSVIEDMVDTLAEGPHLGETGGYKRYVSAIPGDAAITLYVDAERVFEFGWPLLVEMMGPPAEAAARLEAIGELGQALSPFGMKVVADKDGVSVISRSAHAGLGSTSLLAGIVTVPVWMTTFQVDARFGEDEIFIEEDELQDLELEVEEDDVEELGEIEMRTE